MNHPAFVRRVLALVLTAAVAVAAALPGFAVYAMPIQTTYPQSRSTSSMPTPARPSWNRTRIWSGMWPA